MADQMCKWCNSVIHEFEGGWADYSGYHDLKCMLSPNSRHEPATPSGEVAQPEAERICGIVSAYEDAPDLHTGCALSKDHDGPHSDGDYSWGPPAQERTHTLKTWPQYFEAVCDGSKRFELRVNNREFQVGDVLVLQEWYPDVEAYSGRSKSVRVRYIAQGVFGLPDNLCVMSIEPCAQPEPQPAGTEPRGFHWGSRCVECGGQIPAGQTQRCEHGGWCSHHVPHALNSQLAALKQKHDDTLALINTPETEDFFKGIEIEAAHQRLRWPSECDAGKTQADWFWLVGYLAGKCLYAALAGDSDKALHHTISTAAALANWHRAIKGFGNMRPGIATPVEDSALDTATALESK